MKLQANKIMLECVIYIINRKGKQTVEITPNISAEACTCMFQITEHELRAQNSW